MKEEEIEKKALELYPEKLVNSARLCSVNPPIYFNEQVDSNASLREAYIKCWKDNFANQPEQLPSNLDKAAEEYAKQHSKKHPLDSPTRYLGFKDGAKWMAEQGVSYETELGWEMDGDRAFPELDPPVNDLLMPSDMSLNFNDGDKVIVQIRKAE